MWISEQNSLVLRQNSFSSHRIHPNFNSIWVFCDSPFVTNDSGEFLLGELGVELMEDLLEGGRVQASLLVLHHRVGRVLSFFSSRRNWDSPTPHPQASVPCVPPLAPPLVPGGGAHSLARERVGESMFRLGDINCGTLYTVSMYFVSYILQLTIGVYPDSAFPSHAYPDPVFSPVLTRSWQKSVFFKFFYNIYLRVKASFVAVEGSPGSLYPQISSTTTGLPDGAEISWVLPVVSLMTGMPQNQINVELPMIVTVTVCHGTIYYITLCYGNNIMFHTFP
jgi:hypothetical protein